MSRQIYRLALVAGLVLAPAGVAAQEYQVIVNASNPVTELTAHEIAQLFQKKVTRWDGGAAVLPVDLPVPSPVRAAFTTAVHGRSVAALRAYWQRQIFSGRGVPPVEHATEQAVLDFVVANPNAIGYVAATTPLPAGVTALRVQGGAE